MRLGFFLREAFRSIGRSAIPSFAAIATVLVTMLVLGVFIPIIQATTGAANEVRGRVLVNVYLERKATEDDVARVKALIERTDHVKRVEFISKEKAYQELRKKNKNSPELLKLLGSNPLPYTFRITPDKPENVDRIRNSLEPVGVSGKRSAADDAIDEVKNREDETKKILSVTRVVKLMVAVLAVLLVLASVLLISNTIRLSLFSRRREIEVMKLVGATDWFIRWPFMLEGVLLGAVGGGLAIVLLTLGKVVLLDPITSNFSLLSSPETIGFPALTGVLIAASVVISAIGTGISLRRFLRV